MGRRRPLRPRRGGSRADRGSARRCSAGSRAGRSPRRSSSRSSAATAGTATSSTSSRRRGGRRSATSTSRRSPPGSAGSSTRWPATRSIALRLTCLAAGIGVIVLVALMVRELGGGWRAQLAAALGWALLPVALGSASIFHPTWFDQLAWAAFLYVALRVARSPRAAALAGARPRRRDRARDEVHDRGALVVAFTIGLLATPSRRLLTTRGPWLAAGSRCSSSCRTSSGRRSTAGRASTSPRARTRRPPRTPRGSPTSSRGVLFLGLAGAVVAVVGIVLALAASAPAAARDRAGRRDARLPRRARAELLPAAGRHDRVRGGDRRARRLAARGRPRALRGRRRARPRPARGAGRGGAARPAGALDRVDGPRRDLEGHVLQGRARLAGARRPDRAGVAQRCPAADRSDGVVLAANYGEASALEHYGPRRGLPLVLSGHLSWQYWRPRRLDQRFALVVGYDPGFLAEICSSWRTARRASTTAGTSRTRSRGG